MIAEQLPEILKPLWTGESVFCRCRHHVNCHNTGQMPVCNYRTAGILELCNCTEFIAQNREDIEI